MKKIKIPIIDSFGLFCGPVNKFVKDVIGDGDIEFHDPVRTLIIDALGGENVDDNRRSDYFALKNNLMLNSIDCSICKDAAAKTAEQITDTNTKHEFIKNITDVMKDPKNFRAWEWLDENNYSKEILEILNDKY